MKTPQNRITSTVKELSERGCTFLVSIQGELQDDYYCVQVTAKQLSKAVFRGNRRDEVIVDLQRSRNGALTALVLEIPSNSPTLLPLR